jgi:hypothetical protein
MVVYQQDEKDVSKVFSVFRAHLQAKEKELLELQRSDPSLLAPDAEQIDTMLLAIASLQLSTQDGAFVFASNSDDDIDDSSSVSSDCLSEFNAIKTIPPCMWLSESHFLNQQNEQPSNIFGHLLSLPLNTYLASSTPIKTQNQSVRTASMLNQFLSMPIEIFKPSSSGETPAKTQSQPVGSGSMLNRFFSTPIETFKPSSLVETPIKTQIQSGATVSMLNPFLSMPIDAFKSSSNSVAPVQIKENDNVQNTVLERRSSIKSVFEGDEAYSKQYWLQSKQTRRKSIFDSDSTYSKSYWIQNNQETTQTIQTPTKSLVNDGSIFSKQFWVQNSTPTTSSSTKSLVNDGAMFSKQLWISNN